MTFGRPQAIQGRPPAIDLPCEVELATLDEDPSARNFETGQTGSEAVIVFTQSMYSRPLPNLVLRLTRP